MLRPLVIGGLLIAAAPAFGDPCAPGVTLIGDTETVAKLAEVLSARGLAAAAPSCPAVHAEVEKRDGMIVIAIERPGESSVVRSAAEIDTAATVIESWARTELQEPLLVAHEIPEAAVTEARVAAPPRLSLDEQLAPPPERTGRKIHLFAAGESSFASDQTSWLGVHLGACVNLGPVCVASRVRFASVVDGPGVWDRGLRRFGGEVFVGVDVPIKAGPTTVSPGFAGGLGWGITKMQGVEHAGDETGGPRCEAHVTVSVPLSARVALDLSLTGDLAQSTAKETWTMVPLPDEPRALVRVGAGLRYGGL